MRLKEFIIFIIIFTILYISFFIIFDHFSNKIVLEKNKEKKESAFDINQFKFFASFYNITTNINIDTIKSIFFDIKDNYSISLSQMASKYNITIDEFIVVILYLEYKDLIKKRIISKQLDSTSPLSEKDEDLILKYSLLFFNKYNYNTLIEKAGFGAEQELDYMMKKLIIPGVKIENSNIYYIGDSNE